MLPPPPPPPLLLLLLLGRPVADPNGPFLRGGGTEFVCVPHAELEKGCSPTTAVSQFDRDMAEPEPPKKKAKKAKAKAKAKAKGKSKQAAAPKKKSKQ